ncbi:MAG: cytochrome d ubiquinol oxidase subunit II [Ignavibacteriales bacterium]|nr:cytochrome d ubiquinol oxidase subunit II [Ignavibacteriales bacterium]
MPFQFDLNTIWFLLIGVLFTGYAILDGFDLGVGALHLFSKGDTDRRILINSIGPVWDGNEVWLVTGGGALFAAFPNVYASAFSGFYSAFMLLLAVLIFRAVAIEFRSKHPSAIWRRNWDIAFSIASIVIALLMGVSLGNLINGVPLETDGDIYMSLLDMLNPYALLAGVTTLSLFIMHGSIYLVMKTEGALQEQVRGWVNNSIIFFVVCYASITMATLVYFPSMAEPFKQHPWLFSLALLNMLSVANIPRMIHLKKEFFAFLSSCSSIAALLALFAIGMYPNMIISTINTLNNITVYNGSSSQQTLKTMLIIACIGVPFVLTYTIVIYRIFRGKVKIDKMSY